MVVADFLDKEIYDLQNIAGNIKCDLPNEYMDSWEGTIFCQNLKLFTNANIKNLLLKGSILKNTEEILGLTVYTGFNTKIMKNAKKPPIKMSNVMKTMNIILITVFFFQLICCNLFSYAFLDFSQENETYLKFYIQTKNLVSLFTFVIKFFTFLVAYSHLIPISLYVAMEIVKLLQSLFIFYDNLIFDEVSNKPSIARTSELIEELGQVEFIFSDKTGTLTVNKMEFKNCYIGGVIFGKQDNNKRNNINSIDNKIKTNFLNKKKSFTFENIYANFLKELEVNSKSVNPLHFCEDFRIPKILAIPFEKNLNDKDENFFIKTSKSEKTIENNIHFIDEINDEVLEYLDIEPSINNSASELKKNIINFFRVCTLCHSAINEVDINGQDNFVSSSPEETAFLNGSKNVGFTFKNRTPNTIEIYNHYKNCEEIWEILLEIPFQSDRRRMTIVVKQKNDINNMIYVLIKGADETLIPLINLDSLSKISLEGMFENNF